MGAGGRDFHDFNVVYRNDAATRVVAFTAAQIPGIAGRTYPASLAGPLYPDGIPIVSEDALADLLAREAVDEVVLAYSDLSHLDVMHKASVVLSAGADFRLIGPKASMLRSAKPVIAVCATRTGCGKSQTSRRIAQILLGTGLRVALVRHPMPYGDLERARLQRFASIEDIDASHPTVEEREEYEAPVRMGIVVYAGVDYGEILRAAEQEADVIVWDGGNNDFPFIAPDLMITVVDPLRPGHETTYHPGETNLRMANVIVVNKTDTADPASVELVARNARQANPSALLVFATSPVTLEPGPSLRGASVVVIEDGPTITHGGMPYGAGTVAAREAGARPVDPRPYAVGSIARTYRDHPSIGKVLPAMGYGDAQLRALAETVRKTPCDAVIVGTPVDLARLVDLGHPARRASYQLCEVGDLTLETVLSPYLEKWTAWHGSRGQNPT
jgi:predicted GTPase